MTQSVNGQYLYSGGNDGTVRIWDIRTSICLGIIAYHEDKVFEIGEHALTLSRRWWKPCRYLITSSGDGKCCVWLLFEDQCAQNNAGSFLSRASSLVHSPVHHGAGLRGSSHRNNRGYARPVGEDSHSVSDRFYGSVTAEMVMKNGKMPLIINCPRFIFKHQGRIRSFCVCSNDSLCTVGDDGKLDIAFSVYIFDWL